MSRPGATLCAVIALSGAAAAQRAPEPLPTSGSLLRNAGPITPAPVVAISRDQLDASGVPSLGEFLQQLPQQGGALNTQVNTLGDGQTQMNLRNIGSKFTLVLVDGKQMVKGGVGAGSAVDLNAIPTASVERIEVVLDGASALYGSDAIGGVVNVVTRRRIDGVQLSAYGGTSQHRGASVYDVNLLAGAAGDRGNFLLGAGY